MRHGRLHWTYATDILNLAALSTTLIKRLSPTEKALTILVYFSLLSSILTAIPAYFVCAP
jgi:hypothetical protein